MILQINLKGFEDADFVETLLCDTVSDSKAYTVVDRTEEIQKVIEVVETIAGMDWILIEDVVKYCKDLLPKLKEIK